MTNWIPSAKGVWHKVKSELRNPRIPMLIITKTRCDISTVGTGADDLPSEPTVCGDCISDINVEI